MELKSLNCPNCGAVVKIPDGVERFLCPYCHSQIQIDDGKITIDLNANINLNHQYTDVAKMRELKMEEEERRRRAAEADYKRKEPLRWWIAVGIWTAVNLLTLLLMGLLISNSHDDVTAASYRIASKISVFFVLNIPIVPIILIKKLPEKYTSQKHGCATQLAWWFLIFIIEYIILVGVGHKLSITLP